MVENLIADSSFYICFLDDINQPKYLISILNHFKIYIGIHIKSELEKSKNFNEIEGLIEENLLDFPYFQFGELLRPFFSKLEIKKGDHEVIAMAVILNNLNGNIILVIDDSGPRKIIMYHFPSLENNLYYTISFIKKCYSTYDLLNKNDVLIILNEIKKSKFRVKRFLIEREIMNIKNS